MEMTDIAVQPAVERVGATPVVVEKKDAKPKVEEVKVVEVKPAEPKAVAPKTEEKKVEEVKVVKKDDVKPEPVPVVVEQKNVAETKAPKKKRSFRERFYWYPLGQHNTKVTEESKSEGYIHKKVNSTRNKALYHVVKYK